MQLRNKNLKFVPVSVRSRFYPRQAWIFFKLSFATSLWWSSLRFLRFLSPTDIKNSLLFFPFSSLKGAVGHAISLKKGDAVLFFGNNAAGMKLNVTFHIGLYAYVRWRHNQNFIHWKVTIFFYPCYSLKSFSLTHLTNFFVTTNLDGIKKKSNRNSPSKSGVEQLEDQNAPCIFPSFNFVALKDWGWSFCRSV